MLQLYKSYILPIFDYGCFVYGAAKEHILNKLNPVHNSGIRIATGALRSSPIPSLLVEAGVPPLQLRRTQLAMSYAAKIASCPANPSYRLLFPDDIDADIYPPNKPKPLCLRESHGVETIPTHQGHLGTSAKNKNVITVLESLKDCLDKVALNLLSE
ncbi:hypothetical protein M8J75_013785 [Diaphorina citri]|nr:hypothetical protein M8J75_013785 [Diaphorina citri]